jgi:hypothetical protein
VSEIKVLGVGESFKQSSLETCYICFMRHSIEHDGERETNQRSISDFSSGRYLLDSDQLIKFIFLFIDMYIYLVIPIVLSVSILHRLSLLMYNITLNNNKEN